MFENLGIPEKYKTAVILGIVAFFLILVILIVKSINRFRMENVESQVNNIQQTNLSYNLSSYSQFADKIEKAFKPGGPTSLGWGTDEANIYEVIGSMKTKDDVLQLMKSFGVRDGFTLYEYLLDELDNDELAQVNQMLKNRQIDLQFLPIK